MHIIMNNTVFINTFNINRDITGHLLLKVMDL